MKLVKEHIDFKRGLDPKKAMDIGLNPWKNIKDGSVIILLNDCPKIGHYAGMILRITFFIEDGRPRDKIRIKYEGFYNINNFNYNNKIDFRSDWTLSKNFFENNFGIIKL